MIYAILQAFITPGEQQEIALFEPCWPCYFDHIYLAGATSVPIPLEFKDGTWKFDPIVFRKSLSDKTRVLILNNAHNPTGKIFS